MAYDQYGNFNPYSRPIFQPNQPQAPQNVYAFVNGVEGAKSFIVAANQTVLLMDSEQPVCYMKTANALGQGSLRYFKLTEVKEEDVRTSAQAKTAPSISLSSNEDFIALKKQVAELEKKLGEKHV